MNKSINTSLKNKKRVSTHNNGKIYHIKLYYTFVISYEKILQKQYLKVCRQEIFQADSACFFFINGYILILQSCYFKQNIIYSLIFQTLKSCHKKKMKTCKWIKMKQVPMYIYYHAKKNNFKSNFNYYVSNHTISIFQILAQTNL